MDAIQVMVTLPKTTHDIGETLSAAHTEQKSTNRSAFLKIIQNIRFLGKQDISL